jgi:hypothetical protein
LCPDCTDEAPYYCSALSECIADKQVCIDACNDTPEMQWCEAQNDCVYIGNCFGGDGDGDGDADAGIEPL